MRLHTRPSGILLIILLLTLSNRAFSQLTKQEIDSLQRELSKAKEDTNKVKLLMNLGNNVGYYDAKKALEYAKQGYALSTKLKYAVGTGRTLYLWGTTETDLGNYSASDSLLTAAEKIFTTLNRKNYLGMIYNSRGSSSYMQGNYWASADNYTKAATILDEIKDTSSEMIAYSNLISVLTEIKNYEKAVQLSKKLLAFGETIRDTLQIGYSLQSLTTNLIYMDSLDQAMKYIPALITITEKTIDHNLTAEGFSTIATYFYFRKDYYSALGYFRKALENGILMDNKYQMANHNKSLGSTYLKMNDLPLAKKYLSEALRLAKMYNNKRAEFNATFALSDYYDKAKDFNNAYHFLKQYLDIKDSIMNTETRNHATYIETLYETNKKEAKILRLQQVQEEKDFAIKLRNTWIIIGAGLLLALIIIFSLLYNNYRNKQKLSRQQAALQEEKIAVMEKQQQVVSLQSMINGQETERTRIAKDLHDGLGGIFSTVKMHFSTLQHEVPDLRGNQLYRKSFDLVDSASEELRKIAHNMMPEVLLKIGLISALQDFCNNINAGRLLHISLQEYGMEKRLSASTEIMLYRIIQELINNIIKHAYASEAIIQINREGSRLSITVEDNGRGFDTQEAEQKRSMGMQTIKSRVDYLNGKLSIDSQKDVGTTIMIDLLVNE